MFSKDKRRHRQLMAVADSLIEKATFLASVSSRAYEQVTPAHVVSAAFGRYQLRVEEAEATEYLRAVLVQRNHPFDHLPESAPAAGE